MDEQLCALALSRVEGVGPVQAKAILERFGSARNACQASAEEWIEMGYSARLRLGCLDQLDDAERILRLHRQKGIVCMGLMDPAYPHRLRQIPDPPTVLFGLGSFGSRRRVIGVVGTRRMTQYGREFLQRFVQELRAMDLSVVSGLAYGVDSAAHERCLIEGVHTVAVLAHGLDRIYPAANRKLARSMVKAKGALVSEHPFGTEVHPGLFPRRNRILAGMVDAVVVVESAEKGGALLTAELALDYDREVLAVPGNAGATYSRGCHRLIQASKAHLIEGVEDMQRVLGWDGAVSGLPLADLSEQDREVLEILDRFGIQHFDVLGQRLQLSPPKLAARLLELELKNCISSLPGKRYRAI